MFKKSVYLLQLSSEFRSQSCQQEQQTQLIKLTTGGRHRANSILQLFRKSWEETGGKTWEEMGETDKTKIKGDTNVLIFILFSISYFNFHHITAGLGSLIGQ